MGNELRGKVVYAVDVIDDGMVIEYVIFADEKDASKFATAQRKRGFESYASPVIVR